MNKEEFIEEKKELIDMLVWAYTQGYQHATEVLKKTVPEASKLQEMFAEHMLNHNTEETES